MSRHSWLEVHTVGLVLLLACSNADSANSGGGASAVSQQEIEQTVLPLHDTWAAAPMTRDCTPLEDMFWEDFVYTTPDGNREDGPAQVAFCRQDRNTYRVSENRDVMIRSFGSD